VQEEVEATVLDVAATMRTVRRGISLLEWVAAAQAGRSADGEAAPRGAAAGLVAWPCFPGAAHAWTARHPCLPGRIGPGEICTLSGAVVDLLRAFPYDFLYGNIAADTLDGQEVRARGPALPRLARGPEIFDLAHTDPLRAFGLGYLSHLPRTRWPTTSRTAAARAHLQHGALGHSYGEPVETHLGPRSEQGRSSFLQDHTPSARTSTTIISPRLFSVGTSRRLFRGMVHLTRARAGAGRSR